MRSSNINALIAGLVLLCSPAFASWFYSSATAGGGGPTYLISQGFEGTGYDNSETWTEAGAGTKDEDYTTTVLAGSQSFNGAFTAANGTTSSPAFAGTADCWVYFLLRPLALPSASLITANVRGAAAVECVRFRVQGTGELAIRAGGGTEAVTVSQVAVGTTYHVWIHYVKGTGANAVASVAFSTDGVRPTSGNGFAQSSNGTATADATNFIIGPTSNSTQSFIWDKIRVDDATIGDNPT